MNQAKPLNATAGYKSVNVWYDLYPQIYRMILRFFDVMKDITETYSFTSIVVVILN